MNARQQTHEDFGHTSDCRKSGCPDEEMPEQSRSGIHFLTPTSDFTICGQQDATQRVYRSIQGKSGHMWLYAIQENAGENIYVSGGRNSQGFGGDTLTFRLQDGTDLELKGPWHSNAVDLFNDTGVNLLNTFYTFGVIGHGFKSIGYHQSRVFDVIYKDEAPTLGALDRIDVLAQETANELGHRVYYWKRSAGMISSGFVKPQMKPEVAQAVKGNR